MIRFDGLWGTPDESSEPEDPNSDFPIRETYKDCAGQEHVFVISIFAVSIGSALHASEEGTDRGYFFREFDPTSPYLALGRLRGRIRQALSTRHIEEREPGNFQATHRTLRGRIGYDAREVGFVIDGQFLTLQQFGNMVETFEGFEFRLDILD